MKYKSIYVAATEQHVGKTTSTLGLISNFIKKGVNVGYCKPVGQKFINLKNLKVDKDAVLFADMMHFKLVSNVHSPVILGKGATTEYIDDPDSFHYLEAIELASAILEQEYDLVIYEGTGHPGVGSVVDLSNSTVAKMLNAAVIMIVEGGIGNTLDRLDLSLSKFIADDVPILGIIVNKVLPEKMDKIHYYLEKKLKDKDFPILGMLPYDESMAYPLMRTITKAVKGVFLYNEENQTNRIREIIGGSLEQIQDLKKLSDLLLISSSRTFDRALDSIVKVCEERGIEKSPLAGVVVTGLYPINDKCLDYVKENNIPLVRTKLDTYSSVLQISNIEVKINTRTPWKVSKAVKLIEGNVDLDYVLKQLELPEKKPR